MIQRKSLVTAAASEPITLTEAKAQCRVEVSDDDTLLTAFIAAARGHIETISSRALITQTWDVFLDEFPCGDTIQLPLGKMQSITAFEWTDSAGSSFAWSVSGTNLTSGGVTMAHVDALSEFGGEVKLAYSQSWPVATLKTVNPIRIRGVFGYGVAAAVPDPIKHAMKLLISHWYDNRSAVVISDRGVVANLEIPFAVSALLSSYVIR